MAIKIILNKDKLELGEQLRVAPSPQTEKRGQQLQVPIIKPVIVPKSVPVPTSQPINTPKK